MSEAHGANADRRTAWQLGQSDPGAAHGLEPAPIHPDWILEGNPSARVRRLAGSSDDRAFTVMWDCTAGRFNWYYDVDETIVLLEGSVIVTDERGQRHTLQASDTFLFPYGSRYHWHVPDYVRKIAFVHLPLPRRLRLAQGAYRRLKGWLGLRPKGASNGGAALGGG